MQDSRGFGRRVREMSGKYRCTDHSGAIAGWHCQDCGRALCPDCVAGETLENGGRLLSCSACDGRVDQLMEPGGTGTVRRQLWQVVQVPVSWFTVLLGPLTVW